MASNGKRATLYDFRDLDLLLKLEKEADLEGWVETAAAADALGFGDNSLPISRRFAWMRRYGMLEFDPRRKMWRLTPGAQRVTEARTRAAGAKRMERLDDESLIEVMSKVTQRYLHGSPLVASMLRREFLYGTKARL